MTKIIGITGGMGTGKSTVCEIFNSLGILIYNADSRAKFLMENNASLIQEIKFNFGEKVYDDKNKLNKKLMSELVFDNESKLLLLNSLVHPVVFADFKEWLIKHELHSYVIKEAAIMFESGSNKENDFNIVVSSPLELRINRIMKRDSITKEQILSRINHQIPQEELIELCDFEINNSENSFLIPQVLEIHNRIKNGKRG